MKFPNYLKVVGSTGRKKIGAKDIDLISVNKELPKVYDYFKKKFKNIIVNRFGKKMMSITADGQKYDVWYSSKEDLPFMLLAYSYPSGFNIGLRKKAKNLGYKLTQYGLFKDNIKLPIKTIKGIFKKLGVIYRSPQEQELKK